MNNIYQLDFFKDPETCRIESEIQAIRVSLSNVRKGLFARHNSLEFRIQKIEEDLEFLKKCICKGESNAN
jgi:hypothetical protein